MFISVLELFKIGIGPSSSHTMGPIVAANDFINLVNQEQSITTSSKSLSVRCTLKGSLAFTGKGHSTDSAVTLGLHGYLPAELADKDVTAVIKNLNSRSSIRINENLNFSFIPDTHIIFDMVESFSEHPNGMVFEVIDNDNVVLFSEVYFSIGGGFISTLENINQIQAPLKMEVDSSYKYPFDSAKSMLTMANNDSISIAQMKLINELSQLKQDTLFDGIDGIWQAMQTCLESGLKTEGTLPGGLNVPRRAKCLYEGIINDITGSNINDLLCAYAMAVNEENAAGNMVVTAPTNGASGVIPSVLYYFVTHENGTKEQIRDFFLTASAIGGLIKHRSSISGAEVGCQGEVGSASAMAAAGLCAIRGGTPEQVENAAEIALEHHLGMTCDPVKGLVQVPCIERNGFGAIKAYTAASLALRGNGKHFMPLDGCIKAMKQTGLEMSYKYKETSLGGLAVSITEC